MREDVALVHTGSIPVGRPKVECTRGQTGLKAWAYEAGDCRLESCRVRQSSSGQILLPNRCKGDCQRVVMFTALVGR